MSQAQVEEYEGLDALLSRAYEAGCREIEVGPAEGVGETEACFGATVVVVTADGRKMTRVGYARPGDCQAETVRPEADLWARERAQTRALRKCLEMAFPREFCEGQPKHQKHLQARLRELADQEGYHRDALAMMVAGKFGVGSTTELDAEQCDRAVQWLESLDLGK